MRNFKNDILSVVDGKPIEAVVIGAFGWADNYSGEKGIDKDKQTVILSWEEAAPLLDYEFDDGFGGVDCHAVYVWTADEVFFVVQYDGSTGLTSVPRNPTAGPVEMPGG